MAKYEFLDTVEDTHRYQLPDPDKEGETMDVFDTQKFAKGDVVTSGKPPMDAKRFDRIVGYGFAKKVK